MYKYFIEDLNSKLPDYNMPATYMYIFNIYTFDVVINFCTVKQI